MNILFYHRDETCPTMGGVQRVTSNVAEGLTKDFGHKCYNFYDYEYEYPGDVPRYKYIDSTRLPFRPSAEQIADLLEKWDIDIVINQMVVDMNGTFRKAIELSGRECMLYYFHHTTPRRLWDLSYRGAWRAVRNMPTLKRRLKRLAAAMTYPFFPIFYKQFTLIKNARDYRRIYQESDKFILLSKYFYEEWKGLTGIRDEKKLYAIPNARSFDTEADKEVIARKEKSVLIVARMEEFPKQILMALKIWKRITAKKEFADWRLDLVGTGIDLELFKSYVKRHKIPRAFFHGRQESYEYYKQASIFMLPSYREGWPMTLNEAMQMGAVPVAFDSFGSVREIIEDGQTGFIVKPFNQNEFQRRVEDLMKDDKLRSKMGLQAVQSTRRFTKEKILKLWQEIL